MLRSWNGEAGHALRAVVILEKHDAGHSVSALEIDQMRSAANRRGFFGAHSAIAEIVQLKGKQGWISCSLEKSTDDLLDLARERSDGYRIPDLQQQSLEIIRQ